jgi:hypothetical protein
MALSKNSIILLNWARTRFNKQTIRLRQEFQPKILSAQENCVMLHNFLAALDIENQDKKTYSKAVKFTFHWIDIFTPILKFFPRWSETRLKKRYQEIESLLIFWQDKITGYQESIDSYKITNEVALLVNTSCFFYDSSLFNFSSETHHMSIIDTITHDKVDHLLLGKISKRKSIPIFNIPENYSCINLQHKFLETWDIEEGAKINANLVDSFYEPMPKGDCIYQDIAKMLEFQESITMTGEEIKELIYSLK